MKFKTSQELLDNLIEYQLSKKVSKAKEILQSKFSFVEIRPLGDASEFQVAKYNKEPWDSEIIAWNSDFAYARLYLIWD